MDYLGRWRKWKRTSPVPYRSSNHPTLANHSLETLELQQFVPSTLTIDPDFLYDDYIRMACSHTTFVCEQDMPVRRAPVSIGPRVKKLVRQVRGGANNLPPSKCSSTSVSNETYTFFNNSAFNDSKSDDEQ